MRKILLVALGIMGCGGGSTTPITNNDPPAVASITIDGASGALTPPQIVQLTATTRDASGNTLTGRTISWASSAPAIATVNNGLVSAATPGSATITASSEGKSANFSITVNAIPPAPVATVAISGVAGPIIPGVTLQLTAATRDSNGTGLTGRSVTWSASPESVASVSSSGLVTALAQGTVTITATSEGKSGTAVVTVNAPPPVPVATVVVTAAKTSFVAGETASYTATTKDAQGNTLAGRTIVWSSTPQSVATVSATGLVTSVAAGNATVTATSEGIAGTVSIVVTANNAASILEQHVLAQQGLAIALASTVLQSQLYTLIILDGGEASTCVSLGGNGSVRLTTVPGVIPAQVNFYFDATCTRPYMQETVSVYTEAAGGNFHIVATAQYTGPTGTALGSIAFDEQANDISLTTARINGSVHGLGTFTSLSGAPSVRLGLDCDFSAPAHNIGICQGGIAQNFTALSTALGSVTTLTLDSASTGVLSFAGTSALRSGALSSLTLTQPTNTSMVVNGGTAYGATTASGSAANFSLFPPTPTGWSVSDATNDQVFSLTVTDNITRTSAATIKRISTGATLATISLDQSGTGTITYSSGVSAPITSWMLSQ